MKTNTAKRARGLTSRVRADANDPVTIVKEMNVAFNAFKEAHEKEMADIKKGVADVVQTEQIERINTTITDLTGALEASNSKISALQMGVGGGRPEVSPEAVQHSKAFNTFFRRGDENGLRDLEVKASLVTSSDPDGGYVVPEETETTIDRVLGTVSALRGVARVIKASAPTYKKLVNQGGASSGWVGEKDSRPGTDTPTLNEIQINAMEIYANPAATQTLLDDARIDIAAWLADEVSIEFGEQEGAAFITGNGVGKPRGIVSYDKVANASYAWGKTGFVATGTSGGFDGTNPADGMIDLYYALKSGYRNNAKWIMSDATMHIVRKFKDGDGNYLWAAPNAAAEVPTILNKPAITDDNMPAIAANSFSVGFADFQRAYTILDRMGVRVLRDPYTNKPYVSFYTTKRVGGGITNFEAIKLLKMAS